MMTNVLWELAAFKTLTEKSFPMERELPME